MSVKSAVSFLTLTSILLSACGSVETIPQEMVTLRMTISEQISYAPIFIAEQEGYFAEFGIQIEYVTFNRSSEALALLVAGEIDIYAGTLNAGFLNSAFESGEIKAVADRGHIEPGACTYQAIFVRKDLLESGAVTGPQDLKGLTFSVSTAGPSAYFLSTYLAQAGLSFEDIRLVDLSVPAEIDALETGALDGGVVPEPNLTYILNSGNAAVLAGAEDVLGVYQSGIIAFNKKLLVDQRDVGARFLAAYLKGIRQYNQGKTEHNLQILAQATGDSLENLHSYCWISLRPDGSIDFSGVEGFQQWSVSQGHLDNPITEEQFWDPGLLADALVLLQP
jgi:NitT/TauT family transport system substrate-binding protein